ncbi:DUF3846 domain-containing protein [Eubacteriales bacterium OttesenSCG-928-G02]|nr:DUF3846 domain-containing protein [Eubacteriales bacterium OttesenSCG-928-G02]
MYLKITAETQKLETIGTPVTLKVLQQGVGGWIEIVRPKWMPNGLLMIVDEEGMLKNSTRNLFASFLYGTQDHGHPIVGDVCFVSERWGDEGPDISDITTNHRIVIEKIFNAFNAD